MVRKGDDGVVRPGYYRSGRALEREIERHRESRARRLRRRLLWFFVATVSGLVLWMALIYGTP